MISLYRRAETLRKEARLLRLIRHEETPDKEDFDIPTREGEEILDHLDDVVTRKKITVNKSTFSFHSQKNDVLFPVLVNIAALILVISGIFIFAQFSEAREQSIISDSGVLLSTEGRLIEKLKKESEEQLLLKDTEISETMEKLEQIRVERNLLQLEMDNKIQLRENKLRAELDQILSAERQKMEARGLSSTDIEQQLLLMETNRNRENDEQLTAFIRESREEMDQKEAALIKIKVEYENLLQEKQSQQLALKNELKAREESEAARSSISENLKSMRKQQQDEQLVLAQIRTFYEQVKTDLDNADYDTALSQLATLKEYISQESIAALPMMENRRTMEIFIIDSISRLIDKERTGSEPDTAMLTDDAVRLTQISGLVEEADKLFLNGDAEAASLLYLEAFNRIPVLRSSYDKLKSMNGQLSKDDAERLTQRLLITESDLLNAREDIESYENRINRLYEIAEEHRISTIKRQTLSEKISSARVLSDESLSDPNAGNSQEELLTLLQAKLLMKQILNSESVKSEYPELYEQVEEYFTAFGEEKKKEGKYSTIQDITAFFNILSNSETDPNTEQPLNVGNTDIEKTLYSEFLEELKSLIESAG
jgi:hypothetical protein